MGQVQAEKTLPLPAENVVPKDRSLRILLLITVFVIGILSLGKVFLDIALETSSNHVSGTWTALAADLSNGTFYRPIFSEANGYGGTRFFPLFFSLHALGLRFGLPPLVAGHAVGLISSILLLLSFHVLSCRLGMNLLLGGALSILLLASSSVQYGLATIRGDVLPLALNLAGLCVYLGCHGKMRGLLAALCFTLAFSAKITALQGIIALCIWLLVERRGKEAFFVGAITGIGWTLFLAGLFFGTHGRIFEIFRACASGGASWFTLIKAPLNFLLTFQEDIFGLLLFTGAVAVLSVFPRRYGLTLPGIFFVVTFILSVFLFGSPGIEFNHLIDLTVSSVLLLGFVAEKTEPDGQRVAIVGLVLSALFGNAGTVPYVKESMKIYCTGQRDPRQEVVKAVADGQGTILSEDPLIPILAGEKPYILDAFMLRIFRMKDRSIGNPLFEKLRKREFRALVFITDPLSNRQWYVDTHFGEGFLEVATKYYQPSGSFGRFHVYR
jgi:hypothetical protein